jgi:hypothetical protein
MPSQISDFGPRKFAGTQSSPARSNLPESVSAFVQISIRLAFQSGKCSLVDASARHSR